jgi:uncharacterized protein
MGKKLTVNLLPGFWGDWLEINNRQAIFHQWQQLEASGCIENFRLAAGEAQGFRAGWFFADSDAYKWLEAAARVWVLTQDAQLEELMEAFIALLGRAQEPDGYLFTYNQLHFPGTRWRNLQIEHELYCHGHLIEAGVSHYLATGREDLLRLARRAADRIAGDFLDKGPEFTPGHEEIEIALLRLHTVSPGDTTYLALARQFIEQRGRIRHFASHIYQQNRDTRRRMKTVRRLRQEFKNSNPGSRLYQLPPGNRAKKSFLTPLQWMLSALKGEYNQQHAPVVRQTLPVGHAVRFAYLETAVAMLARLGGDKKYLPPLEMTWRKMLVHRMYLTGGIGSQPGLEGFGRNDALDPEYAYAETCAALGSLFWNWEMTRLTGQEYYSDLFEWQLYNAALVGLGRDGSTYLYNNPLASRGGITRRAWYSVPCCPSNLSRTLADMGKYIYSSSPGILNLHQYISSEWDASGLPPEQAACPGLRVRMSSDLPWQGKVRLEIVNLPLTGNKIPSFSIHLRQPAWAQAVTITINGTQVLAGDFRQDGASPAPSSGFDPTRAAFVPLQHSWVEGDMVEITFDMPIQVRCAPSRVRSCRGKVALTRGPLVYCLESVDNPGVDIFSEQLDECSLQLVDKPDILGGIQVMTAKSKSGTPLTFIPYHLWGNRGETKMTVWVGG